MPENQSVEAKRGRKMSDFIGILLVIVFLPLLIALGVCSLIYGIFLRLTIWAFYCTRGTNVLFVYSDSPIWKDYLDQHVVPHLPDSTLRLNWSERSTWNRASFPVRIFRYFGGDKAFNPLAVVFHPFRKAKVFRFWQPFKDFKHGKAEALELLQADLLKEFNALK